MEDIIVWTLVVVAAYYLIQQFSGSFSSKKSCKGGCSGCGTIDWKQLEAQALQEEKD